MPRRVSILALQLFITIGTLFAPCTAAFAETKDYIVTAPDGVTLSVQESGDPDGKAIIFIHGLLGSHLNWNAQVDSDRLKHYRIITYDLRGHGLSGKPTDPESYRDGRRWAQDLAAVIEASHARNPVIVGWSLGGTVISNYLAAFGDSKIAGAIYVDGVIELKSEQLVSHPEIYRDLVSADLKNHLDAEHTFLGLCFNTPPDKLTFELLLANAAMASWEMQRTIQTMTIAAPEGFSKMQKPVLLLYGALDALVLPEPSISRAIALNARVKSKTYANSGHAPFIEEPARFNNDLADFIEATATR